MVENSYKSNHGNKAIEQLVTMFNYYKKKGYIKEYKYPFTTGYKNKNNKQFYFQFMIVLSNDEKWIVHSTTSIRSDRINIQQWNSGHIKMIMNDISLAIIVFPDDISDKERDIAERYYQKISQGKIFSSIDHIVSLNGLSLMIEKKHLEGMSVGQQNCFKGNNFEKQLVEILNNESNLTKFKTASKVETGFNYPYFLYIMNFLSINSTSSIKSIEATNDIPLLPSRGKAKTDILLTIELENNIKKTYTFSCKRTSKDWVSVHEYPVIKFIEVLGITDSELIEALYKFQEVGGKKALISTDKKLVEVLTRELPKYNRKLSHWVLGGQGGDGDPKIQWAEYLITYRNETCELQLHLLDEYVKKILEVVGHFGTPFKWTYPSGGKGKRIQLKGKIL